MTISARSTLPALALALAGSLACACSDPGPGLDARGSTDAAADDAGATPDAADMDAPTPTDDAPSPADDAPSGSDAPSTNDAGSSDAPLATDAPRAVDAPGPDAPGAVRLEIRDPAAYGNCFMGPPDPLLVFWTLRASGPAGERVTVESATLSVQVASTGYTETQTLTLDVPSFTIDGTGTTDQEQRKTAGSPSVPICTFCGTAVMGELVLDVNTSTGSQRVTAPLGDIGCVF